MRLNNCIVLILQSYKVTWVYTPMYMQLYMVVEQFVFWFFNATGILCTTLQSLASALYIHSSFHVTTEQEPSLCALFQYFAVQRRELCAIYYKCVLQLGVGDCFGTFEVIDGQTMHKSMLMVHTNELVCEFLKVTTSDFQRVIEVRGLLVLLPK